MFVETNLMGIRPAQRQKARCLLLLISLSALFVGGALGSLGGYFFFLHHQLSHDPASHTPIGSDLLQKVSLLELKQDEDAIGLATNMKKILQQETIKMERWAAFWQLLSQSALTLQNIQWQDAEVIMTVNGSLVLTEHFLGQARKVNGISQAEILEYRPSKASSQQQDTSRIWIRFENTLEDKPKRPLLDESDGNS